MTIHQHCETKTKTLTKQHPRKLTTQPHLHPEPQNHHLFLLLQHEEATEEIQRPRTTQKWHLFKGQEMNSLEPGRLRRNLNQLFFSTITFSCSPHTTIVQLHRCCIAAKPASKLHDRSIKINLRRLAEKPQTKRNLNNEQLQR